VHLFVSELYRFQNAWSKDKKKDEYVLCEDINFPWVSFIKKYVTYFMCVKYFILFISLFSTFLFILMHHDYNTPYALSYTESGISPHGYSK